MILDEIFDEVGIKDIIYEYSCGVKYRVLEKSIKKHFKSLVEKSLNNNQLIYINLTYYFSRVLSRGYFINEELHIKIFLRHVSRLLSNKKDIGIRMLFNTNQNTDGLYMAIGDMIKEIEEIIGCRIANIYYANR